jgi:hypothetical protein
LGNGRESQPQIENWNWVYGKCQVSEEVNVFTHYGESHLNIGFAFEGKEKSTFNDLLKRFDLKDKFL